MPTKLDEVAALEYEDRAVVANTTYYYKLKAKLFTAFAPYNLLDMNTFMLPTGIYVFYFCIDTVMNGIVDGNVLHYQSVMLFLVGTDQGLPPE